MIICSALKDRDTNVIFSGIRHADIYEMLYNLGYKIDAIIADNSKFKAYWNTHPEEVEEICRKFSEKYVDERCKYLKVERAPLSCEKGFVYPGDRTFCLKKDRELLDLFECKDCEYKKRPTSD